MDQEDVLYGVFNSMQEARDWIYAYIPGLRWQILNDEQVGPNPQYTQV